MPQLSTWRKPLRNLLCLALGLVFCIALQTGRREPSAPKQHSNHKTPNLLRITDQVSRIEQAEQPTVDHSIQLIEHVEAIPQPKLFPDSDTIDFSTVFVIEDDQFVSNLSVEFSPTAVVQAADRTIPNLGESRLDADSLNIQFAPGKDVFVLEVQTHQAGNVDDVIQFAKDKEPWLKKEDIFWKANDPQPQPSFTPVESQELRDNGGDIEKKFGLDQTVDDAYTWHVPLESGTAQQLARKVRIRKCLDFYYSRLLNTTNDSPWSVMHHMIAWGSESQIWVDRFNGRRVSAIGWLCANGKCENERLLTLENGTITPRIGPGLQGHEGQFLAMLAQARVQEAQPIKVDGYDFNVRDLIDQEKKSCIANTELTFKLIGLVHYLHTTESWQSEDGQDWDFPRLIREEIRQPINGVTCGGTHRLMGMSYAIRRRVQDGLPIDGEFKRAEKYTADFRDFAYQLRTPEGSFSTDFFRSPQNTGDMNRKLKTTGHVLEWIIFSSPHDQLQDPRLLRALDLLTQWLVDNRYFDWNTGPLGHAVRALALYDERVYGGQPGRRGFTVAENPPWIAPNPNKPKNRAKASMARQEQPPVVEVARPPVRRGFNILRRGVR